MPKHRVYSIRLTRRNTGQYIELGEKLGLKFEYVIYQLYYENQAKNQSV